MADSSWGNWANYCAIVTAWCGRPRFSGASPTALRWKLESGRWQQPCHGVVVTQSGPLSASQQLWGAVLWGGRGAVLGGGGGRRWPVPTRATLAGLHGFTQSRIHLLVPAPRQVRREPIRISIT